MCLSFDFFLSISFHVGFMDEELYNISDIFTKSTVIAKVMLPYWHSAVQFYKEKRSEVSLVCIL